MTARVLSLFGTRPEVIKLAPVIAQLEKLTGAFATVNVASSQHTSLLHPFAESFGIRIDRDLAVMRPDQSPHEVCARVLSAMQGVIAEERPDVILVQGDTTTVVAGALAGFYSGVPVGHVEAGLRTANPRSPFPEEMNRRLVSRLASYHFAATEHNRRTLLGEGIPADAIFVTGNPVVDALHWVLAQPRPRSAVDDVLEATDGLRLIALTTHRRESLGPTMRRNLAVLRAFVDGRADTALVFPVHPNPAVVAAARSELRDHPRIHLVDPLGYHDFIHLLSASWLIVSDSGGVQEEAPTLGKPVLILRENTERPEAVEAGVARLVGGDPERLASLLEELDSDPSWIRSVATIDNPFGRGDSARRIVSTLADLLGVRTPDITLDADSAA